jgi:hypothetical protein
MCVLGVMYEYVRGHVCVLGVMHVCVRVAIFSLFLRFFY